MCFACDNRVIGSLFAKRTGSGLGNAALLTRRELMAAGMAAGALTMLPFGAKTLADEAAGGHDKLTVLRKGRVYTMEKSRPWAECVAVRGNRIVYVGDNAGAAGFIAKADEMIDLEGRMLLPGFIESHFHFFTLGFARGAFVNSGQPEEIKAALRDYARMHPRETFTLGFGWIVAEFPVTGPRKELLDQIFPDRPVLLIGNTLHDYWVNSRFLQIAGITRETPRDVVPGLSWYEKDPATGEPTGYICEVPALFAVLETLEKHGIEPFGLKAVAAGIEEWQAKLAAAGVTSYFDAGFCCWPTTQHHGFDILLDLERRGELRHRVVASLYHNDPNIDPLPLMREYKRKYQTPLVQVNVLKLSLDGSEASRTAYYLEPYADKPGWHGEPLFPPEILNRIVRQADAEGIDTYVHAVGDAAVRITLDAYEAAFKASNRADRRHTISHAFLTAPSDIARFKQLGVIANTQIQWGVPDPYQLRTRKVLGEARWNQMYRFKSFMDAGVVVTFGTDGLATGYKVVFKPLEAIQAGHTRQEPGKPDGPVQPPASERLGIAELIQGYTLNGAYQMRMENKVGSITAGKLADLIVLEKNLFDVQPHDIGKVGVQLTMMNGRITHRDAI